MIRIDFVVDENLKVYLMEANMSPSITSVGTTERILVYDQLIYNIFGLVGVASNIYRRSFETISKDVDSMLSSYPNFVTNSEVCSSRACEEYCDAVDCELCLNCMSDNDKQELNNAYREYKNRGEFKRIIPGTMDRSKGLNETELATLSKKNQFMSKWFYGKCFMDEAWC